MADPAGEDGQSDDRELYLQPVAAYNPFEEALSQLARVIRLGIVAVGEKLPPERELSKQLGVSRTTVREAIRGLEQAGYVTSRRGRFGGTFVLRDEALLGEHDRRRALGPQVVETLDYRYAIEPGAAALAAERAEKAQIEQMLALVDEMEDADQSDQITFVRKNCRLHILFAQASQCAPLLKTISTLEMQVMDAFLAMPKMSRSEEHSHAQHRAVIAAIAKGDRRKARDALDEHLEGSGLLMRELVASKRPAARRPKKP